MNNYCICRQKCRQQANARIKYPSSNAELQLHKVWIECFGCPTVYRDVMELSISRRIRKHKSLLLLSRTYDCVKQSVLRAESDSAAVMAEWREMGATVTISPLCSARLYRSSSGAKVADAASGEGDE